MGTLTEGWDRSADRLRHLLLLDALPGVGPIRVRALCMHFGGARAALEAPARAFREVASDEAAAARTSGALRSTIDEALKRAEAAGIDAVSWGDPRYPVSFLQLADPPPVLFLRGRPELLAPDRGVTVVGSRRVTARGRGTANRLGRALAGRGAVVVSGLALGTDAAAHEGAIQVGGDTVAVLGSGPDVPYPRTHEALYRRIVRDGLVVSEFLPGTRAAPHHFPRRNRLLAALGGRGVVVVEAGEKSGSLITVDHALDLGCDVWAIPGPIDGPACAGSNRLLADGARPLVQIDEFVRSACAGLPVPGGAPPGPVAERRAAGPDPGHASTIRASARSGSSDPDVTRVLEALREGPAAAQTLADRSGLPVGAVLAALTRLELDGFVERLPGLRFRSAA